MLVVVVGAASSHNDGGARARGARSLGARRRGVSEGGSGLLGCAAAFVVGLLVVGVAVVLCRSVVLGDGGGSRQCLAADGFRVLFGRAFSLQSQSECIIFVSQKQG